MTSTALTRRSFRRLGRCAAALVVTAGTIMAGRFYTYVSRERQLSDGVNEKWIVRSESVARENSQHISPFLIPNEWIATNIARLMGLPCPPPALMRRGRVRMFCSLSFDSADSPPRDANPSRCVSSLPDLCAGIVVFDILVANADRHAGNLKVDDPFQPKRIDVFDHDHCLFGWRAGQANARNRLRSLEGRLGITAGFASGGNRHCLLDELTTCAGLSPWVDRADKIPDYYIEILCRDAVGVGVNRATSDAACAFLIRRKGELESLILNHKEAFTNIHDWTLFV